jgi:hypothetical protein
MVGDHGEYASQPELRDDALVAELHTVISSSECLDQVSDALIAGVAEPERELARISQSAYRQLGVSEDVRAFMGQLWAAAMRSWNSSQRATFLLLTVQDRYEVFEALDFTAELFKHRQFTADELLPWLKNARSRVGKDLMQRGLWSSVEAICTTSPAEAVHLAMRWLDEAPDAQSLSTIATIVGCVREQPPNAQKASAELATLENRLRAGDSLWRSAYIQSWARWAARGLLTRDRATELFDELVTQGADTEVAWCYLLHVLAEHKTVDADHWTWLGDQLTRVARSGLAPPAQYWLVLAVLKGLSKGVKSGVVVILKRWLDILGSLCPISAASHETWSQLTGALVDFTKTAPNLMQDMVVVLATHTGREWLAAHDRNEFRWFLMELAKQNQHTSVAGLLCFQTGMYCRRLGMRVFADANVPTLDPTIVSTVPLKSIELLLLETLRFHIDYGALARLHALLGERVDEEGVELPNLFYEEVARQCRNTYAYRKSLRAAALNNAYLLAIVDDSESRIKETRESFASPSLQMDVPGYARARRLSDQYMARAVAKGVAEKSVFLNLIHKVHLLYGGEKWRLFRPDGSLSEPSSLKSSSSEIEMPQFEIANPEGAQMRRLQASARIARLEKEIGASVS